MRRVRQALLRPGSQERPVRLLHLREAVQGRRRTCSARYLNAPRVEDFVVEKIRERILTEETIVELVTLVAEEVDAMAGELAGRLEVVEVELGDVRKRLERLYEALETSELTLEVLSPRIFSSEAP